jgi:hypothetical protein
MAAGLASEIAFAESPEAGVIFERVADPARVSGSELKGKVDGVEILLRQITAVDQSDRRAAAQDVENGEQEQ